MKCLDLTNLTLLIGVYRKVSLGKKIKKMSL